MAWLEFTAAVGIAAAVVVGFGLAVARRGPAPVAGWLAVVAGGGVAVRAGLILAGWRL